MDLYPFNPSESMAVARLVWVLIFSDGKVDPRESAFFEQMLESMNITSADFDASLSTPIESVYELVKEMPALKRRECASLLRVAISLDEVVVLSEVSRLNDILEKTAIFRPDRKNNVTEEG